jgi:hypothetical protein
MSLKKFQPKKKKKPVQVNIITPFNNDDIKRKSLNMFDVKSYKRRMVKFSDILDAKYPIGTHERKLKVKKKKIKKNKNKKHTDKIRNDNIL